MNLLYFFKRFIISILTPLSFSYYSGHFKSSLSGKAMTKKGKPLAWFTYPAIDFLVTKDFTDSEILEFGGGQSTLFWLNIAKSVTTFETDIKWKKNIEKFITPQDPVKIILAPSNNSQINFVNNFLSDKGKKYDVIIVDGMDRSNLFPIAVNYLSDDGMIICDNAEGYDFYEIWCQFPDFNRIDFTGHAPGVLSPHTTSLIFGKL